MNRLPIAVISTALSVVSTLAAAQQPCDARTKPTACYVDSALSSLEDCQKASPPRNAPLACIEDGEARIEPLYENAIYASDRIGHTQLLKDFRASFQAAMDGIRPKGKERPTAYKARQLADRNALEAKADRLKAD